MPSISLLIVLVFSFEYINIVILAILMSLLLIPSLPFVGLFLMTEFFLVMGHIFPLLGMSSGFLLEGEHCEFHIVNC